MRAEKCSPIIVISLEVIVKLNRRAAEKKERGKGLTICNSIKKNVKKKKTKTKNPEMMQTCTYLLLSAW